MTAGLYRVTFALQNLNVEAIDCFDLHTDGLSMVLFSFRPSFDFCSDLISVSD